MDRRGRWFGLALIVSAGLAWWRFLRRPAPDRDRPDPASRPAPPQLAVVPDRVEPVDRVEPIEPSDQTAPTWVEPIDGECPDGYPIKVNERSGIFHVPGGLSYDRTSPTRCYATADAAEADGFRRAKR